MLTPRSLVSALLLVGVTLLPWRAARAQAEAPDSARPAPAEKAAPAAKAPRPRKAAKAKPAAKPAAPAPAPDPATDPAEVPVDPYASPEATDAPKVGVPPRLGLADLGAMQGLLAVQRLDGWLLRDLAGANPVAVRLVAPIFVPQQVWFYLLPVTGEPVVLCHQGDAGAFEKVSARQVTYQSDRERDKALRALLKGKKSVALELPATATATPPAKLAELAPVEVRAALRALRITPVSSDHLVQYTSAVWGERGYLAHLIAAHHLVELRKDALAFVAQQLRAGVAVTDHDVAQRLQRGMAMRGVVGPAPSVAAGVGSATPSHEPTAEGAVAIKDGDVLTIGLAVKVDRPDGIFAAQTWVAFVGASVPDRVRDLFAAVAQARDQAIALIAARTRNRQPLRGYEVDLAARKLLAKAYPAERFAHALGHSIDTAVDGAGADLDAFAARDQRTLVAGTGVTVGPGLYFPGELGLRSEVTVFLSPSGPQVTTPAQQAVQALLAP